MGNQTGSCTNAARGQESGGLGLQCPGIPQVPVPCVNRSLPEPSSRGSQGTIPAVQEHSSGSRNQPPSSPRPMADAPVGKATSSVAVEALIQKPPKMARTYFDLDLGQGPAMDTESESHKYVFRSGAVYEGEWQKGSRHGEGQQRWADGAVYIGEWYRGLASGKGRLTLVDGESFTGEFVSGRAHGWGTFEFKSGAACAVYRGEFRCDLRDGAGVESWPDGSNYAGQFKHGKKSGYGVNTWPDGTEYSGQWEDNQISGRGYFQVKNGLSYHGQWLMSMPHGIGSYRWKDGRLYEGEYKQDKKHGFGIYTEHGQDPREGYWKNGRLIT